MDLELKGKTALITGASAGIGRSIAVALGREGMQLAITARREGAAQETVALVVAAGGAAPAVIIKEQLDDDAPDVVASGAMEALGSVDVLVNNAGGSRPFSLHTDEAHWREALTLNFDRHRQLTDRLIDQMTTRGWGRVINITGKSEPEGINGAFCAKAAIHSWAKGLSREVGPHGVTVNCIPPGRIMSDQIRRNYSPEHRAEQSATEIPMRRYGEPEELAVLVAFLASPLAQYITGTVIPVDGGLRKYQF